MSLGGKGLTTSKQTNKQIRLRSLRSRHIFVEQSKKKIIRIMKYVLSLTHSLTHSNSLTHSLTHPPTHSLTYSFTHSLTHSHGSTTTRSVTTRKVQKYSIVCRHVEKFEAHCLKNTNVSQSESNILSIVCTVLL
jgi:hypothetical protein